MKAAVKGVLQILDNSCQAKTVTEAWDFDGGHFFFVKGGAATKNKRWSFRSEKAGKFENCGEYGIVWVLIFHFRGVL